MATAVASHQEGIESKQELFSRQIVQVELLSLSIFGLWVIELIAPTLFNYPFFKWGGWESVFKFWPLFAYCIGFNVLIEFISISEKTIPRKENSALLGWNIAISVLAGFWEELEFRWIYICYAMLSIDMMNWMFGTLLGLVACIACLIGALFLWSKKEKFFAAAALVGAVFCGLFAFYVNPLHLLYPVLVWVIHYTTLTLMDPVFQGNTPQLFLFGAIAANVVFCDSHKYQGVYGFISSWFCGMVLLYATIQYGLWTAVVVHVLYNITIAVIRFAFQKTH